MTLPQRAGTTGLLKRAAAVTVTILLGAAAPAAASVPAVPAGTISLTAGGVGGPGQATAVSLAAGPATVLGKGPCGVWPAGRGFYIGDVTAVRQVGPQDLLTTVAGTGNNSAVGDGGPAGQASLLGACAVTTDGAGNVVIADNGRENGLSFRVRVAAAHNGTFYGQAMTAGNIYTVAGNGFAGQGGIGVPATQTNLSGPSGVAVDHSGNLVIADSGVGSIAARLRVVAARTGTFYHHKMVAGDIYTVAGSRTGSTATGDGGPARNAGLGGNIGHVLVDQAGNLVLAGIDTSRIRVVAAHTGSFYGQPMTSGDIYTVAGDGTAGFSGDGGPAVTAELQNPAGVGLDPAGNLLIADTINNRIRVVAAHTGSFYGQPMTAGHIYTVTGNGTAGFSGDGGLATAARIRGPGDVSADAAGNLLIADSGNARVRLVAAATGSFYGRAMTAGRIYTVAGNAGVFTSDSGDGRPATTGQIDRPGELAAGKTGTVLFTDSGNNRVQVVPASTGARFGRAMTAGDMYTVAGDGTAGFSGDRGPGTSAQLWSPEGVAADAAGNAVIADTANQRIRVVAAASGTFYGQAMTAGDVYTVAGTGSLGQSGDGGPATQATIADPRGVAVDTAGNIVIADTENDKIRVVAAASGTFYGRAMTAGDIYTVAGNGTAGFSGDGGPATSAEFRIPAGVAPDGTGNLVIADTANQRIRVVAAASGTFYGQAMTAGDVYTVAGNGTAGSGGDGGPATAAEFSDPGEVSVDGAGNLVIADTENGLIRVVAGRTGSFYGVAMTAGDIYPVAGGGADPGTDGLGDGGPATGAVLQQPFGVAAAPAGNLLISDTSDNRIRTVTGG